MSDLLTDPEGSIELHGTARAADGAFAGPFTGEECPICETLAEEHRSNRCGSSWTEIDSASRSVPFPLEDDSGSVLVDPLRAEVRMGSDTVDDVDGGSAPPGRTQRYIESDDGISCGSRRLDRRPFSVPTDADRRYTERRIRPGGEIYVLGRARSETTRAGSVDAVVGHRSDVLAPLIGDGSVRRDGLRALRRVGTYLGEGPSVTSVSVLVLVV